MKNALLATCIAAAFIPTFADAQPALQTCSATNYSSNSTSPVAVGSNCSYTPKYTGIVKIRIDFSAYVGNNCQMEWMIGTGLETAPLTAGQALNPKWTLVKPLASRAPAWNGAYYLSEEQENIEATVQLVTGVATSIDLFFDVTNSQCQVSADNTYIQITEYNH